MKKITPKEPIDNYELLPEYRLDFSKARPNRFAKRNIGQKIILLDPDVAKVFPDGKTVNDTLRAIVNIIPLRGRRPKHSTQRKKSA